MIINSRWSGECNEVNYKVTFFVFLRMSVFEMLIRYKNVFSFLDEELTDNTRCSIEFCPALTNKYIHLQKLHYYRNPQKPINTFSPLWKYFFTFNRSHIFFLQRIDRLLCFNACHKKKLSFMQHDRIEANRSIDPQLIFFVSFFLAKVSSPMFMYMKKNLRALLCHHRHFSEN